MAQIKFVTFKKKDHLLLFYLVDYLFYSRINVDAQTYNQVTIQEWSTPLESRVIRFCIDGALLVLFTTYKILHTKNL